MDPTLPTIGAGYQGQIGVRSISGQTTPEYYNATSGQGFSTPADLASYVNSINPGAKVDQSSVFGHVASYTKPAPSADTSGTGSGKDATPSSIYTPDPNQAGIDAAQRAAGIASGYLNPDGTPAAAPDPAKIRSDTLSRYQDQIDAIDKAAAVERANISTKYASIDNERVGEQRALLANTGMLGQVSGASEKSKLDSSNADEVGAALAQSDAKFQQQKNALLGIVQQSSDAAYQAKLDAYTKGADSAVANLKSRTQTANDSLSTSMRAFIAQHPDANLNDTKWASTVDKLISDMAASGLPTNKQSVLDAFNTAQTAYNSAKAAASKANQTTLTPGQEIYRTNPDGSVTKVAAAPQADKFTTAKDASGNPLAFDSTTGKYTNQDGTPFNGTPAHTGDNTGLLDQPTVDKFLADKDPGAVTAFNNMSDLDKSDVMQLINGDTLLSDLMSSRGITGSAARQQLLLKARAVDHNFSENLNKQRYAFKTDWNNPNSQAYNKRIAANTALSHLSTLNDLANQLGGTPFKLVNGVAQFLQSNVDTNKTAVLAQFNDTTYLLATELAKAYTGGVPNSVDIAEQMKQLNANSPQDVKNAVINNKVTLLTGALTSQANQFKNTMGAYPQQMVDRNVLDEMQAKGIDTQGITKTLIQQGMPASSLHDYISAFPDKAATATKIVQDHPGISEQDVLKVLQGDSPYFNNVSGDTNGAASPTSMRTDRNNNPTAMTTDVAKTAGLVEGTDYVRGDPFRDSKGNTFYTAKLLGDPVATTIKAIDKAGFYTASGQQRWTHTAISQGQWNAMSYAQKAGVVQQMYHNEGGTKLSAAFNNIKAG